jgi:hypothetical protein
LLIFSFKEKFRLMAGAARLELTFTPWDVPGVPSSLYLFWNKKNGRGGKT